MATSNEWELQWTESDRRFYRTINEIRLQWGLPLISHPSLQTEHEERDRTILVKIHLEIYPISWEILDKVFAKFGIIEYLEIFCPGEQYHSKIRFQGKESAIEAFESINHREIYEGCCRLELFWPSSTQSPSPSNQEITESSSQLDEGLSQAGLQIQFESSKTGREFRVVSESSTPSMQMGVNKTEAEHVWLEGVKEIAYPTMDRDQEIDEGLKHSIKVTSNPPEVMKYDGAVKGLGQLVLLLIELMEIKLAKSRIDSSDCLRTPSVHKMFFKMPRRGVQLVTGLGVDDSCLNHVSSRLRSVSGGTELNQDVIKLPYDRGKSGNEASSTCFLMVLIVSYNELATVKGFVFDPGGIDPLLVRSRGQLSAHPSCFVGLIKVYRILDGILIFDPGGELAGPSTYVISWLVFVIGCKCTESQQVSILGPQFK